MIKSYRAIHQWDHWLSLYLGNEVIKAESKVLSQCLARFYGKHAILIGVPRQYPLLENSPIMDRLLLTPLLQHNKNIRYIESNWNDLPIASGSVDLVILPHTLEYNDHPQTILSEACRIVKPDGKLVIFGFNPYSFWGMGKSVNDTEGHASMISQGHLLQPNFIKKWLSLADFELLKQKSFLFRPPLKQNKLFERLKIFEWIGNKLHLPFGGIYILIASAKVIPLTPIRMHWKQHAEGVKLTIPGPSVRNRS